MVQPIAFRVASVSSAEEREHHPALAIRPMPCNRQRIDRTVSAAIRPFRRDPCDGLKHQINQPQNRLGISTHRTRSDGGQKGSFRDIELDRLKHACICGHLSEHMLQRDIAGCDGR